VREEPGQRGADMSSRNLIDFRLRFLSVLTPYIHTNNIIISVVIFENLENKQNNECHSILKIMVNPVKSINKL